MLQQHKLKPDQLLGVTLIGFNDIDIEDNLAPHIIHHYREVLDNEITQVFRCDAFYLNAKRSLEQLVREFCESAEACELFQARTNVDLRLGSMSFLEVAHLLEVHRKYSTEICQKCFKQMRQMDEVEWFVLYFSSKTIDMLHVLIFRLMLSEIRRIRKLCNEQSNITRIHTIDHVVPLINKFLNDLKMNVFSRMIY